MLKNTCSTCGALIANDGVDLHEGFHAALRLALVKLSADQRVDVYGGGL